MSNRILHLVIVAVSLLSATTWAQNAHYEVPAASIDEQFAAYHDALSNAADDLLTAASAQRLSGQSHNLAPSPSANAPDEAVHRFAASYWNGQDANVRRALQRVASLRPLVEPILREEGVPIELAAIMLVESGGRTTALSPKGARGVWQFMPETARRYGLNISTVQDDRTDVAKSTRAAARYLRDLQSRFGDWQLAFAAYNAGETVVQRATDRTGGNNFAALAASRAIPAETRNYVPAVLSAIALLGGNPLVSAGQSSVPVAALFVSQNTPSTSKPSRQQKGRVLFAEAEGSK